MVIFCICSWGSPCKRASVQLWESYYKKIVCILFLFLITHSSLLKWLQRRKKWPTEKASPRSLQSSLSGSWAELSCSEGCWRYKPQEGGATAGSDGAGAGELWHGGCKLRAGESLWFWDLLAALAVCPKLKGGRCQECPPAWLAAILGFCQYFCWHCL